MRDAWSQRDVLDVSLGKGAGVGTHHDASACAGKKLSYRRSWGLQRPDSAARLVKSCSAASLHGPGRACGVGAAASVATSCVVSLPCFLEACRSALQREASRTLQDIVPR